MMGHADSPHDGALPACAARSEDAAKLSRIFAQDASSAIADDAPVPG
jgi:hypothetical protein